MSQDELISSQILKSNSKSTSSFQTAASDDENAGFENALEEYQTDLLCLSEPTIYFEPISGLTNVFFDKENQQIFCVRSNGVGGVIVKGANTDRNLSFRMEDKGNVVSIKFSPNMNVLAIRRQDKSIDFLNFKNAQPVFPEYSQTFKAKSTQFQDFYWLDSNEILLVSELGFEHYQIYAEKRALKLIKFYSMQLNWLIWSREAQVFIISTGSYGSILNPFLYSKGGFIKLPKFEVDLPLPPNLSKYRYDSSQQSGSGQNRYFLNEADVVLGRIYKEFYVMVIRQMTQPANSSYGRSGTNNNPRASLMNGYSEIAMYKLLSEGPAKKTNVLRVHLVGRFTLNIIDELIVVHHRLTYSSMIFDIKLQGEFDGFVTYNYPIIKNATIKPTEIPLVYSSNNILDSNSKMVSSITSNLSNSTQNEMYSMNWIMFLPNVIIDAKIGCFWFLELNLKDGDLRPFSDFGENYVQLVEFLLNRKNTQRQILLVCANAIKAKSSLKIIETLFSKINAYLAWYYNVKNSNQTNSPNSSGGGGSNSNGNNSLNNSFNNGNSSNQINFDQLPIIEQLMIHDSILYPLLEDEKWWNANSKYTIAIIVEYFRSLNFLQIPIENNLYKLLVDALIKSNRLYQLHQYLQYHVLLDGKPLACLLLSIESKYPIANQLALDMLKRTGESIDDIVDVLLSKGLVLSAIRYAIQNNIADKIMPGKFLETAKDLNNSLIYFEVFKYFEDRNVRLRGTPAFKSDENCDAYVKHFNNLFQSKQTSSSSTRRTTLIPN